MCKKVKERKKRPTRKKKKRNPICMDGINCYGFKLKESQEV